MPPSSVSFWPLTSLPAAASLPVHALYFSRIAWISVGEYLAISSGAPLRISMNWGIGSSSCRGKGFHPRMPRPSRASDAPSRPRHAPRTNGPVGNRHPSGRKSNVGALHAGMALHLPRTGGDFPGSAARESAPGPPANGLPVAAPGRGQRVVRSTRGCQPTPGGDNVDRARSPRPSTNPFGLAHRCLLSTRCR